MKAYQYIFLLVIAAVSNCKEKEPDYELWFPYEADTWIDFKVGTYWVYQNDITLEIDTLKVVSIGVDSIKEGKDKYYNKYCICQSTNNFNSFNMDVGSISPGVSLCKDNKLRQCIYGLPLPVENKNEIGFEITGDLSIIDTIYDTYYLESMDTMLNEVIKVDVTNDQVQQVENTSYYWHKPIGIIKIDLIQTNQSWTLIDHFKP